MAGSCPSTQILTQCEDTSYLMYLPRNRLVDLMMANNFKSSSVMLPKGNAIKVSDRSVISLRTLDDVQQHAVYTFSDADRFVPARLTLNNRKGRKAIVVLAEGDRSYLVMSYDDAHA